jgi:hypothetical protein
MKIIKHMLPIVLLNGLLPVLGTPAASTAPSQPLNVASDKQLEQATNLVNKGNDITGLFTELR